MLVRRIQFKVTSHTIEKTGDLENNKWCIQSKPTHQRTLKRTLWCGECWNEVYCTYESTRTRLMSWLHKGKPRTVLYSMELHCAESTIVRLVRRSTRIVCKPTKKHSKVEHIVWHSLFKLMKGISLASTRHDDLCLFYMWCACECECLCAYVCGRINVCSLIIIGPIENGKLFIEVSRWGQ